jgi:hypothetical protein
LRRSLDTSLNHDLGNLQVIPHEVGVRLIRKLDADQWLGVPFYALQDHFTVSQIDDF